MVGAGDCRCGTMGLSWLLSTQLQAHAQLALLALLIAAEAAVEVAQMQQVQIWPWLPGRWCWALKRRPSSERRVSSMQPWSKSSLMSPKQNKTEPRPVPVSTADSAADMGTVGMTGVLVVMRQGQAQGQEQAQEPMMQIVPHAFLEAVVVHSGVAKRYVDAEGGLART